MKLRFQLKPFQIVFSLFWIFIFYGCNETVEKGSIEDIDVKKLESLYEDAVFNYYKYTNEEVGKKLDSLLSLVESRPKIDTTFNIKFYRFYSQFLGINIETEKALKYANKLIKLHENASSKDTLKLLSDYHFITRFSFDNGLLNKALYDGIFPQKKIAIKNIHFSKISNEKFWPYLRFYFNAINSEYTIYKELGDFSKNKEWVKENEQYIVLLIKFLSENPKFRSKAKESYEIQNMYYHIANSSFHLSEYYNRLNINEKVYFYDASFAKLFYPTNGYQKNSYILRQFRANLYHDKDTLDNRYNEALKSFRNSVYDGSKNTTSLQYLDNRNLKLLAEITSRYAELRFDDDDEKIKWHKKAIKYMDTTKLDYETHPLYSIGKLLNIYEKQKNKDELQKYIGLFRDYSKQINQINKILLLNGYEARFSLQYESKAQSLFALDNLFKSYNLNSYEQKDIKAFNAVTGLQQDVINCIKTGNAIKSFNRNNPNTKIDALPIFMLASSLLKSYIGNEPSNEDIKLKKVIKSSLLQLTSLEKNQKTNVTKTTLASIEQLEKPLLYEKIKLNELFNFRGLFDLNSKLESIKNKEKVILEKLNYGSLPSEKKDIQKQYLDILNDKQNTLDVIREKVPNLYMVENTSINEQLNLNLLKSNEVIVKLVNDDANTYAFIIEKNNLKLKKIGTKDRLLSISNSIKSDKISFNLNSTFFNSLKEDIQKFKFVKFVTDTDLNAIPVEFIINKNQTGSYASTLFLSDKENITSKTRTLVVNPNYNSAFPKKVKNLVRSGNFSLPFANEEAHYISSLFVGRELFKKDATKENYIKNASDYNIHHLAMHAVVDEDDNYNASLLFQGTRQEDYLNLNEIYNLNIDADLVTLSACNTAYGKIDPVEGALSLSRAFQYAGAKATLTSLWRVPDRETSIIMKSFYTHLKDGKRKDVALKLAKDDYLNAQVEEQFKHPYYWAGFILTGDTSPIVNPTPWWVWALAGTVIMVLLILFLKRKKKLS